MNKTPEDVAIEQAVNQLNALGYVSVRVAKTAPKHYRVVIAVTKEAFQNVFNACSEWIEHEERRSVVVGMTCGRAVITLMWHVNDDGSIADLVGMINHEFNATV